MIYEKHTCCNSKKKEYVDEWNKVAGDWIDVTMFFINPIPWQTIWKQEYYRITSTNPNLQPIKTFKHDKYNHKDINFLQSIDNRFVLCLYFNHIVWFQNKFCNDLFVTTKLHHTT